MYLTPPKAMQASLRFPERGFLRVYGRFCSKQGRNYGNTAVVEQKLRIQRPLVIQEVYNVTWLVHLHLYYNKLLVFLRCKIAVLFESKFFGANQRTNAMTINHWPSSHVKKTILSVLYLFQKSNLVNKIASNVSQYNRLTICELMESVTCNIHFTECGPPWKPVALGSSSIYNSVSEVQYFKKAN